MEMFEQFKCPSCDESVTYVSFTIFRVRRTRSRGDTVELAKWTFLFVLALWCITITDAMEAHISVSDPGGLIVFNASLGPGWTYRVEYYKNRSSNYAFLELDSSTGVLYWRGNVRCLNLRDNPIHVNIISSTWHILSTTVVNVTELPYSIFVHGCETTIKNRKPDVDVHKISVGVNIGPSQCIQPLTHLLGLTDFIPINLRQCMIDVDKILSSPLVADDRLVFSSAVKICFNYGSFSVDFALSLMCDSAQLFHLPFRLTMHPYLNKQAHRRYRRAANNRPKFSPTAYTENVKEEQPPGVQVVTITATDTDTEGAGTLTYTMASTRDDRSQSMFAINPLTGTINTTQKLDREFIKAHYFIVIATDHGVPPESASASLTIIVDDVNDHAPRFDQDIYSINFSEGQVVGYPVLTIQATDQDFGKNAELRYSIANPEAPNDAFMIDPVTGAITTMAILDREKLSSFRLLIQAVDQGDVLSERRSSTATVIIQITDENDNSPIFSQQSYQVTVREDQNVSLTVPIIQVNATDADAGKNAEIQYQLSGNNLQKFRIDPVNGKLFLIEQLNYEETQEFSLTVRAEDQGTPSKRTSVTILVRVLDINDNPPKFILDVYEGMVTENVDVDTSILQVQAFDADSGVNSQLTYSFVGEGSNSSLPFVIDSKSAWIRTSGNIDRETRSVYNLKIKAVDNGIPQLSATTSVVITVRDINDNAPIFQSRAYDASVSEEARIGEEVVRVLAVDLDDSENARVIYAITDGNLGESFQMGQSLNEGVISVHKQLDARQFNRFTLTVSATDSGGRKDTVQVFINVTDTNRNAPEFQGTPYHFNVQENIAIGTSVFKVNAIDKDRGENARITYSMDPGISAFAIDPNNGVISTRAPLDRESVPAYTLKVTATDNGKPQLMDTEVIDVTIDDQNDNKPEFTEITYNGHIAEDALPGERVLRITATDRDKDSNGQVIYTFDKGNDGSGDFSIDSALGWIRVAKNLDRERIPSYELVAFAVDRGLNPQSSSVIIRIKIDDVNDNHPQFEAEEINVYITENSPIGSTVAQITATDPDEGLNALVEYSFEGGADVDSFQLSGRKGDPATITTLVNLDYESGKKKYEIILRAASDTQFSTAKIFINVRDVNDNAPILKDFLIIYNNFGGSFPIGPIGRIPASDPDVSDQELLSYQILSGNEASLLYLNSSTGQITLDSRLNSDVPRNGTFQVSVSDGKNVVRATCRLYVRLITPEMLRDSVTIRLDRMTQTAFLSSLLKFFTDALASIFHTEIANIYIINIEDDVDVPQAQILNVSVSVRQRTISVQGRTRDVFYSPEYLREYIYLYRSLLANLSALQVLPFDDNLCLQEPCANFAVCLSTVNEGIAMPFVASDTLLFRPIHPVNGYKCECPHGFAGMQLANACDVEIDLCYSIPCLNNGTCIPHESGYTCQCTSDFQGANCEVNMTTKYDAITCPQNFCQPPSVCVPLIRGGFRCDGCPDDGNYDKFCRLKTRNFRKGSYLTFPSLKKRNRFTVKLRFATQERNGLLLYNGRFNEEHDFIGLEIVNSQVVFSFSLGGNHTSVSAYTPGGVSTGDWFQVTVQYHQREAILIVGGDCDTNIAILYGDKLDNYSCAAKVSHTLPAFCDNPTENCYRLLDLTGPLQLGGLPWAPSAGQVTQNNFIGCISEVYLDDELLDLNTSVAGEFTSVGCQQKLTNCQSSPCTLGGKCKEGWTTFTCDCPEKTGGKDCSQVIEASRQLTGNAYLFYENVAQNIVYYPWYNGLAFRTRAKSGILMQVVLNGDQVVKMQLQDGFVRYSYRENVIDVDSARVNDGQWHYVEARWYAGYVEILLDYGQRQKTMAVTASVSGSSIQRIYVGGFQGGSGPVMEGFVGCVKDVRVGNNPNAILSRPTETGEIRSGCSQAEACDSNPCGPGTCQDLWGASKCLCPPGTIGPRCENICRQYNPCENWAECQQPLPGATTYTCACGSRQSGRYCENMAPLTCPAAWWGDSVCGPCNCDQRKGFESNCNKTNGMCYCKDLHYQLPGEDQCYPCDCYTEGSLGQSCDHNTGQCQCQDGVIGRRCDQCDNIFAGINLSKNTCEIMSYEECPRNYAQKIWWEPVAFGQTAVQDCPPGASGSAKRECAEKTSWLVADLFNCTSDNFTKLASQLADFEAGAISPYSADLAVELLKNATNTTKPLYGGDILMTLNFAMVILKYENNQTGLGLISQQYRDFVQQLVIALSNVTSLENAEFWPRINEMYQGAATLLYLLEQYLLKIATIMPQAQSSPFEVVSDEIVLGADWMTLNNISERSVPKYDNNVNKGSADKFASIKIPSSLFLGAAQGIQEAKSYFGYAIYHSMGKLMVMNTDNTIRRTGLPLTVNGPVFTFVVISQGKQVSGPLSDPVYVRLKLASPSNKTNLQCATWTANSDGRGLWSGSYCSVLDTDCLVTGVDADECLEIYITCKCFHLSTFAVLVDQEDGTAIQQAIVQLEVITYILVGVSLTLLFVVFFILISYKTIYCNWNSIHVNLVFVIFLSELAFVVGINRTTPELFCRLVAIALHYFYMSAFAWLYVEVLHIYRLLTEKHTINYGSMKFYYLLGYVIPGIIVGLAVGLYTDGYGNDSFCWLETSELLIWSFAGPIVVVVVLNIITFMFALKASCREKVNVSDISAIKLGLMGAILLLLLLSITWVLGLLTVNFDIAALGYVHAIFVFLQGTFLFIIYILLAQKVRLCLKRTWYRLRGKKFGMDDGLSGTRSSVASRSALAYRNDSSPDTGFRINVGISTTSTTSQSSKSTGRYRPPHYKDDDFGRSTSSSTSGHVPSGSTYPHNTGIAPYGYEPSAGDALPEEEYAEQSVPKIGGNDSESDSDASVGGNSLDLASSHSSDEDDEFEIGLSWEQQVPKSIKVEQAREQLEKQRKDKERERLGNNNSDIHWVDSSQVDVGVDLDPQPISRPHTSSVPPDVTLSAAAQRTGRKVTIVPPPRTDSLQNNYTGSSNAPSDTGTSSRVKVQVLTHNGSLSSDSESESSGETNV